MRLLYFKLSGCHLPDHHQQDDRCDHTETGEAVQKRCAGKTQIFGYVVGGGFVEAGGEQPFGKNPITTALPINTVNCCTQRNLPRMKPSNRSTVICDLEWVTIGSAENVTTPSNGPTISKVP